MAKKALIQKSQRKPAPVLLPKLSLVQQPVFSRELPELPWWGGAGPIRRAWSDVRQPAAGLRQRCLRLRPASGFRAHAR